MKKIIRLTESDLARIVRRVIKEQVEATAMAAETYYRMHRDYRKSRSGIYVPSNYVMKVA